MLLPGVSPRLFKIAHLLNSFARQEHALRCDLCGRVELNIPPAPTFDKRISLRLERKGFARSDVILLKAPITEAGGGAGLTTPTGGCQGNLSLRRY